MKSMLMGAMLGCMLLAGCASGPVYRPASTPNDYGYRETALADTRYQVSFAGGYGVAREIVQQLALFRAAQVALSQGAESFRVVSRTSDAVTDYSTPVTTIGYGYPFWGTSFGFASSYERTRYETVLEIQIGPDIPESGPDVYDAGEIKRHLAALANTARY